MEHNNKNKEFIYLYHQGSQYQAYGHLGAHIIEGQTIPTVSFSVYAPKATAVSVVGDFNQWNQSKNLMKKDPSGIFYATIPHVKKGDLYKYAITSEDGKTVLKQDPYGYYAQLRPHTASIVEAPFQYRWTDGSWMEKRKSLDHYTSPMNIYEIHLSSWTDIIVDEQVINIKKVGKKIIDYCKQMHYTHIEILPITEYPLDSSWGYQTTGYFSLSGRFSSIRDMQSFINACHKNGLGVILDWVPGHFCPDEHGLLSFDGTSLYGDVSHPNWGTYKFDFTRRHVWSFLLSSAYFFAKAYHIDGIRVDGVSSMMDHNFGNYENYYYKEDAHALSFLRKFNEIIHKDFPGFITIAEDSSDYEGVTSTESEGLGFDYKWDMGWMNDTLDYYMKAYELRENAHNQLTFSSVYAHKEKFLLPFSHDEVVHGKKHMIDKMQGDYIEQFSNLKTLMAYQMFHPGKKLTFMGIEIAQFMEWRYYEPIEWFMLQYPIHNGFHEYIRMLNHFYLTHKPLYELDYSPYGFEWIDADNSKNNVLIFLRRAKLGNNIIIIINNSQMTYENFKVGVPEAGSYKEIFTSNLLQYGGSDLHNKNVMKASHKPWQNRPYHVSITVPSLSATVIEKITGE